MHHDLYGTLCEDIEQVKRAVEAALDCTLQRHESAYVSGDYYRAQLASGESLILKSNIDPLDGEPVEGAASQFPILLYVDNTSRSDEIGSKLGSANISFVLIRHR